MAPLPNPLAPARAAGRLLVSLATAPARGAVAVLEALLDDVAERVLPAEPPPDPGAPAAKPAFGPDAGFADDAPGPAPITPSVARVPSAKRRRTRMRDPGPPAVSVLLLYERAHRGRRTVIDAAERELARRS